MHTLIRAGALTAALATAACGVESDCDVVLASGCVRITPAGGTPPAGWNYWVENDGDEIGYWANQTPPHNATRLAWSKGSGGAIYNTFVCAYSEGTDA